MLSTWSSGKPLVQTPTTLLPLNWRNMGLVGGPFGVYGIGWIAKCKQLHSVAQCPSGNHNEWCPLRICAGISTI